MIPEDLNPAEWSTEEARHWLRVKVADASPKCANCKHMKPVVLEDSRTGTRLTRPVAGKGACFEPGLQAAWRQPVIVTDLMLCSLWEKK